MARVKQTARKSTGGRPSRPADYARGFKRWGMISSAKCLRPAKSSEGGTDSTPGIAEEIVASPA
ncbi:hypothetical protein FRB99_008920, partial [Tulasnella sp. 403]